MTFLLTSVVACFLVSRLELDAYNAQLIGAVTFTANFVLSRQVDYFSGEAEFKPLLHVWSLSPRRAPGQVAHGPPWARIRAYRAFDPRHEIDRR